jgi:anti-sigma-K factor RskA
MDHDTIRALLEEYAVDLLDPTEQAQVEVHLSSCTECQQTVALYRDLVAQLPEVLAARSPHRLPGHVKNSLLQKLQASTNSIPTTATSPTMPAVRTNHQPPVSPVAGFWARLLRPPLRLALVAASLLLVLALAWSVRLNVALARERALRAEFAELAAQQHELVLEIVDSSKTTRRLLLPPAKDSRAYGKVYTRPDFPYVVAMAARLPAPPPGQAYHLWLLQGDQAQLAGLLKVSTDGFGLLIYEAANNQHNYTATQVTLQPEGTTMPVDPPVILWQDKTE